MVVLRSGRVVAVIARDDADAEQFAAADLGDDVIARLDLVNKPEAG
jgi:hypothetical protein